MSVAFPHGPRGHVVSDECFLAGWARWVELFGPGDSQDAADALMPIRAGHGGLADQLANGHRFSLDVLCRMLTPYRSTKQASQAFRTANAHLIEECRLPNPGGGRSLKAVRLTPRARQMLAALRAGERQDIDALLQADVEDAGKDRLIEVGTELNGAAWAPPARVASAATRLDRQAPVSIEQWVGALIDDVQAQEFQPRYRGAPVGAPVTGWVPRLATYFWPEPGVGAQATFARLQPLLRGANGLRGAVQDAVAWTAAQEAQAIALAQAVFRWGGVPQADVTAAKVRAVFESALAGVAQRGAPMNSGWTKLAAIVTDGLGEGEQAIWDSRVAHALISRLDRLLHEAGFTEVPACLAGIGRVDGRGGSRVDAGYRLRWPVGYGKWAAHFAGAALIRRIRDELNRRADTGRAWTVRDVEMVLFMDGY